MRECFKYNEDCKEFFENAASFKTDQDVVKKYDRKLIAGEFAKILHTI